MIGMGQLLLILAIVLVVFGARRLPAVGDALGRTIKNFRRGAAGDDELEVGPRAHQQLTSDAASERDR